MSEQIEKPIVFIAHISYGLCVRASARQVDCHTLKPDDPYQPIRYNTGFSLLAHAFNDAWCQALNQQKLGMNIKYFVMLHDDIVPEDWWVRQLIDDIEPTDFDMVSALVPLKDTSGASSTAVDKFGNKHEQWNPSPGDQYLWERRVTMKEAAKLPAVFTAADCGYADRRLLANTGCWICRFDRPWRHETDEHGNLKMFFKIDNRIHMNNGNWTADCEPEDWFFSRQLQRLGGKVAVTRNVRLTHYGLTPYPNYAKWGCDYDKAFAENVGYTPIGEKQPDINFSYDSTEFPDVRGFLNDDEGRLLAEIAKDKSVLEIGSYCGRSTIWMARTAKSVLAVDTWNGKGMDGEDTLAVFTENICRHKVAHKIDIAGGTIKATRKANGWYEGSPHYNPEGWPFQFIFIDAGHTFEEVQSDIDESLPLLSTDGLVAFHDYARAIDPGVTQAVDLLIKQGAEIVARAGTVIVLKVQNVRRETRTSGEGPAEERHLGGPETNGFGASQEHRDADAASSIVAGESAATFSAVVSA